MKIELDFALSTKLVVAKNEEEWNKLMELHKPQFVDNLPAGRYPVLILVAGVTATPLTEGGVQSNGRCSMTVLPVEELLSCFTASASAGLGDSEMGREI